MGYRGVNNEGKDFARFEFQTGFGRILYNVTTSWHLNHWSFLLTIKCTTVTFVQFIWLQNHENMETIAQITYWKITVYPKKNAHFWRLVCVFYHDDVIKWKFFRVTDPLCGEFTGHRWTPLSTGSNGDFDVSWMWVLISCFEWPVIWGFWCSCDVIVMFRRGKALIHAWPSASLVRPRVFHCH